VTSTFDRLDGCQVRDVCLDIANHTSKVDAKFLLLTLCLFDVTDMSTAAVHDQGLFAETLKALAQFDSLILCPSGHDSCQSLKQKEGSFELPSDR